MVLEKDYVLESLAALGPGGPHMILVLGRSRRAGGMGGDGQLGPTVASPMAALQKWYKMEDLQKSLAFLAIS